MKNLGNIIVGLFAVIVGIAGIVFVVNSISGKYDDAAHGVAAVEAISTSNNTESKEVVQNYSDSITYEFINDDGEAFASYSEEEFKEYLAGTYGSFDDELVINKDDFVEFVIKDLNKLCKDNVVQLRKDDMLNAIDNYEASLSDKIIDRAVDEAMNETVGDTMKEIYTEDTELVETAAEDEEYDSENQGACGCGMINSSDGFMNVRSDASTSSDIITQVYNGDVVEIYDFTTDEPCWYYIEAQTSDGIVYGWIHESGIEVTHWYAN